MTTILDGVIGILLVEALVLAFVLPRLPHAPRFVTLFPNLLAGLFLMLAARSIATEQISLPMLGFLALGGVAHAADLLMRFRATKQPR